MEQDDMSEKQIQRETSEETVSEDEIEKKLEKIQKELDDVQIKPEKQMSESIPARQLQRHQVKQPTQKATPYQLFLQQVPKWTQKPFMYIVPKNEKMRNSWLEKWGDLVLNYCRMTVTHVISIEELRQIEPFRNSQHGKKISLEQMQVLIDYLVSKELARWLDDAKLRARIYYKTLEEFSEMLLKYVLDRGLDTEYLITITEFRNFGQEWSNLPDEDLDEVFKILEQRKKIKPIDKKRDAFSFDV